MPNGGRLTKRIDLAKLQPSKKSQNLSGNSIMKGLIALDIDGTLTAHLYAIPAEVCRCLSSLAKEGWQIALITGRTFSFARPLLEDLDFPYWLALQNGADLLEMPAKKLVRQSYLKGSVVSEIEAAYHGHPEDFIIYSGFAKGDFCYYRPKRFSKELLTYLDELKTLSTEPWKKLELFTFPETEGFPLIKCMGSQHAMEMLSTSIHTISGVTTSLIRDPVSPGLYLHLITHPEATKGRALHFLKERFANQPVIAAGDDRNDLPMLEQADIRIVMSSAPSDVQSVAHILAAPASELGIIAALHEATSHGA